jgi:hypothetical protein
MDYLREAAKDGGGGVHILCIDRRLSHGSDGGGVNGSGEEQMEVQEVGQLLSG